MKAELGYKVKRQDGKAIGEGQIKEIGSGMDDIRKAIGDVKDIMNKEDLTIAQTSGKFPFLNSQASGLFHPNEKSITIGLQIGPFDIKSLAHEFGHFLDYASGPVNKDGVEYYYGSGYSAWRKGPKKIPSLKGAVSNSDEESGRFLDQAAEKMNGSRWSIERAMEISPEMGDKEKDNARRIKAKIGTYYTDRREVFARLFEQYVGEQIGGKNHAADSPSEYHEMPAYWKAHVFEELKPQLKAEIEKRLLLARGQ